MTTTLDRRAFLVGLGTAGAAIAFPAVPVAAESQVRLLEVACYHGMEAPPRPGNGPLSGPAVAGHDVPAGSGELTAGPPPGGFFHSLGRSGLS